MRLEHQTFDQIHKYFIMCISICICTYIVYVQKYMCNFHSIVMIATLLFCILCLVASPDRGSVLAQSKRSHVIHMTGNSGMILLQRYKCGS